MKTDVVIASACRTPIGRFLGGLSSLKVTKLGSQVVRAALERAGLTPDQVDEVILGNALSAGLGQNPARQAALGAEIPPSVGAFTVNKVCGSGLKAVILAAQAIQAGDAEVVVAGGMESMSQAPYLIPKARTGARLGDAALVDHLVHDGLWEINNDYHMGNTAELIAEKYEVDRAAMDAYALQSHQKAAKAEAEGWFAAEMVPVVVPQRKGEPLTIAADEGVRAETTPESLAKLKPAFKRDGAVTAGNASQISDGASALVVMAGARAEALGVTPLARITGYATSGLEPKWIMMTPVQAVKNLEARTGKCWQTYDCYEFNEAFAVQGCAVIRELELDAAKVNVHGGAVALGHPLGCSGARILTTLIYALKQHGGTAGLASLCMGGGNGLALSVELLR